MFRDHLNKLKGNKMKFMLLWLFSVSILLGQVESPFVPFEDKEKDFSNALGPFEIKKADSDTISETESDESVYDLDDVHKWDNVMVKGAGVDDQKIIKWGETSVSSHKDVAGKKQQFKFFIDAKSYEEALRHPDMNRGVILMAGDARYPLLYCWLRPFSVHQGKALFIVSVPVERLGEMQIAFIPHEGKKRYIYSLNEIVLAQKESAKTEKIEKKQ